MIVSGFGHDHYWMVEIDLLVRSVVAVDLAAIDLVGDVPVAVGPAAIGLVAAVVVGHLGYHRHHDRDYFARHLGRRLAHRHDFRLDHCDRRAAVGLSADLNVGLNVDLNVDFGGRPDDRLHSRQALHSLISLAQDLALSNCH